MKTAMCASFNYDIPIGQAITMIKAAGFNAISIGGLINHSNYHTSEGRKNIRRLSEQNSLEIDSIHAPCPEGNRLFSLDEEERVESVRHCKSAIDGAFEVGAKIVVLHLIPYGITEENEKQKAIEQGMRSIDALMKYALKEKMKLAMENGQTQDYDSVLEMFLSQFNDDSTGLCYDSGHENVRGTCFEVLEKFGDRLFTTHLHDNTGSDSHLLPYEGDIEWENFKKTIHGLGYSGNMLLESGMPNSKFKEPEAFLAEAFKIAASFSDEG